LEECRWLYNALLEERKTLWETKKQSTTVFQQQKSTKTLLKTHKGFNGVHSQVIQNVAIRIDLAFKAFFRRCKSGEKPGYPRFKGEGQCHSFTYPQNNGAFKLVKNNHIKLSKVGNVKIKYHREFEGTPKTCTVSKTPTGKWFVCISCDDVKPQTLKPNKLEIGIDMGLKTFATLSDNNKISSPNFFKHEEHALAKAQRKLKKQKKATSERQRAKKVVARVHERVANKRSDFCHKKSLKIVRKYGIICVEDLNIKNMIVKGKFPRLAKSILDSSWGLFLDLLCFKAESAGRTAVKVNPAYTSRDCSACGTRKALKLSERTYSCKACGMSIDRDLNAAKNILTVGLHSLRKSISGSSGSPRL